MSQIRNLDRRIKRLRADNKGIEDINRHQQLALDSALQHAHAKKHEDVTSQIRELNDEGGCEVSATCPPSGHACVT